MAYNSVVVVDSAALLASPSGLAKVAATIIGKHTVASTKTYQNVSGYSREFGTY
jgi:hypothetical protein